MRDPGSVKERVKRFDERHGESIVDGGWIRFPDGAQREVNPMGALQDPPDDPYQRAKRVLSYHRLRLQRATDAFGNRRMELVKHAKTMLNSRTSGPPLVTAEEAKRELERLRQRVQEAKAGYDAAKAALEEVKPASLKARESQDEKYRKQNQALLETVNEIQV